MPASQTARVKPIIIHPLEAIEEVLIRRDLAYDRPIDEEVLAEAPSQWTTLKLWYRWEDSLGVLVFTAAMECKAPKNQHGKIFPLLAAINEKLWLGHFDISSEDGTVMFRHSLLLRDGEEPSAELIDALLDIAITECNRTYPALQSVLWGGMPVNEALDLALFETCGEA